MKIYHGPVNIGGIGGYLSSYQRGKGFLADFVTWQDHTMRQNHDFDLALDKYKNIFTKIGILFFWFIIALLKYTHFHFYYGQTLLPLGADLPILRLFKKKIVMSYCGSDIRLIYIENKRNPYADRLRISSDHPKFDNKKILMMKWQNLWCHKFTALRNLVDSAREVIPEEKLLSDQWINNLGFSIKNCPEIEDVHTQNPPLLIHAPSEPNIKGTEYVRQAIRTLQEKGLEFEYEELQKVPNEQAQEIYRKADIIIDQFLIGGIGTLAFEGMGYGKPVVAYVLEDVIEKYMPDCPIFNATIGNLPERLEQLIVTSELRVKLGKQGIEFVKKHLDPVKINEAVIDLYSSL